MDPERIARFVERQVHGWGSPAGVADLVADYGPDGTFQHPIDPPAIGPDAIQRIYDRFHATCRDALVTLGPVVAQADRAAFEWMYEFTVNKTERRTRLPGVTVARFRPDRIDRWVDYWDSRALFDYLAPIPPNQQRHSVEVVTGPPAFDPEAVTRQQIAGWDDPAALEAMYQGWAADAVFTDPVTPPTGLDGLRAVFEQVHRQCDQVRTMLHTRIAAASYLILEWTITYRGRRSGRVGKMDGTSWVELRDGLIVAWRDYWDTEQIRPRRGVSSE